MSFDILGEIIEEETEAKTCFICGRNLDIFISKDGKVHGGKFVADMYSGGGIFKGYWVCNECSKSLDGEFMSD